jgi:molybdenum cofactor cytidylyltransferase
MLRRVVGEALAARSLSRVLVVVGAHAPVSRAILKGLPVEIVENLDWPRGQGSSLAAGVRALRHRAPDTCAAVVLLSDQPLVTAASIDLLVRTHRRTGARIVASRREDRLETPALLSFAFFEELSALDGDQGAREILRRDRELAVGLDLPGADFDVDTAEDYGRLIALESEESGPRF